MTLWDHDRVERYIRLYGDPRELRGSQSQLCRDAATMMDPKDSVIDFGCGMGHLVPYTRGGYLGLDSSRDMLEAFKNFWPESARVGAYPADVTKDLSSELSKIGLDLSRTYDVSVSVSLFLHLSHEDSLKVLENMWRYAEKAIIFSMETNGDSEIIRNDGIRIRNQGTKSVLSDLDDLFGKSQVKWMHQAYGYRQSFSFTPSARAPLETFFPQLISRTTLFRVSK